MPESPPATVLITTKNRKEELRNAVASALVQSVRPEVLVVDDCSTDGTSEMIGAEFPRVRLDRAEESRGYIVQRNRGARLASAPVIVSIDDDAVFPSPATIEQTLAEFSDPRIAAVAIPYIDVHTGPTVRQRAPDPAGVYITAEYRGTAHALRRDCFLEAGGYRESLVHQTEEGDLCLRLLAAGRLIRLGAADPIHHLESPRRDLTRQITFNARNNLLFTWHHVPGPALPFHAGATTLNLLRHGLRTRYRLATLRGLSRAGLDIASGRAPRRPVPMDVYRLYRWLRARGATPLAEVIPRLESAVGPARS
jgi:glycosyltransferase involved in cell wall biosynthesis